MIILPENIQELKSYKPGKTIQQIKEELGLDRTVVLWNNENCFGSSPMAVEEMKKALEDIHMYPDPLGTRLRERIAAMNNGIITKEQVVLGNGSEGILNDVFRVFFRPGDELLTSEGTFVAVYVWAKANNVTTKLIPLTPDYRFDVEKIADAISPRTKVIYISSPNNPTGSIVTREELSWLMERVPDHVLVVVDEAYYEFAKELTNDYPDSLTLNAPNILTMRTFSKAYGVAGVRIGYAIGSKEVISALVKVKLVFTPSGVAQAGGYGASLDDDFLHKTVQNNKTWLPVFYEEFEKLGLRFVESYGNFVMLDMGAPEAADELFHKLLSKGIFVRVLGGFGLPHCIRVTVGNESDNLYFLRTLKEIIQA